MTMWREAAEECRMKAERVEDPAARRSFLLMARCYEDLAAQLETRLPSAEDRPRPF